MLFLDAPVSGGVTGAKKGSLSIMVGGNKNAFNKSKKILKCLGKKYNSYWRKWHRTNSKSM